MDGNYYFRKYFLVEVHYGLIMSESSRIISQYLNGLCPKCHRPIWKNVRDGDDCVECGYVFTLEPDDYWDYETEEIEKPKIKG